MRTPNIISDSQKPLPDNSLQKAAKFGVFINCQPRNFILQLFYTFFTIPKNIFYKFFTIVIYKILRTSPDLDS